jgi:hypothetical protein
MVLLTADIAVCTEAAAVLLAAKDLTGEPAGARDWAEVVWLGSQSVQKQQRCCWQQMQQMQQMQQTGM